MATKPFPALKKIYHIGASQTGVQSSITNLTNSTLALPHVGKWAHAAMIIGPPWTRKNDPLADTLTMKCAEAVVAAGLELIWGERMLHDWGLPTADARNFTVLTPELFVRGIEHIQQTAARLAEMFGLDRVATAADFEHYGDYQVHAWLNNNHPMNPVLFATCQGAVSEALGRVSRLDYVTPVDSGLRDACGWLWGPMGNTRLSQKSYYLRNPASWFGAVSAPLGQAEVLQGYGVHVDDTDQGPTGPWSPETLIAGLTDKAIMGAHNVAVCIFVYVDPLKEPGVSQRMAAAAGVA